MIINVCGFGCTGASAYYDLIAEFEGVQTLSKNIEFQILQQPDGIVDLYHSLFSGNRILHQNALYSFRKNIKNKRNKPINSVLNNSFYKLTSDYYESLNVISWKGKSSFDSLIYQNYLDKNPFSFLVRCVNRAISPLRVHFKNYKTRYYSPVTKQEFVSKTKDYLLSLFVSAGLSLNNDVLLEQCFGAENPLEGMEFLEQTVSIIVDRDPRDVFILTNYLFKNDNSYMPNSGDVVKFVTYYKALHKNFTTDSRVVYVKFEDLIFNYENTCATIQKLLHKKHIKKKELFKPEISVNNTALYKKFPNLAQQIKYIEDNLGEHLYDFDAVDKEIINVEKADVF